MLFGGGFFDEGLLSAAQNFNKFQLEGWLVQFTLTTFPGGSPEARAVEYLATRIGQLLERLENQQRLEESNDSLRNRTGINPFNFTPDQFAVWFRNLIYTNDELQHLTDQITNGGSDWALNVIKMDGTTCTVPLTGPHGHLFDLVQLLVTPYGTQPLEFHCVSETEHIAPDDIDHIQIWEVVRDYNRNAVIGYLPYAHTTKCNLTRYQFYHYSDTPDHEESCLTHALRLAGITEHDLDAIKARMPQGYYVEKTSLQNVADILNATIRLKQVGLNNGVISHMHTKDYGTGEKMIRLAAFINHIFIYEETAYHKYAINHYDEVKDELNWWDIYAVRTKNGGYRKGNSKDYRRMDSLSLLFFYGIISILYLVIFGIVIPVVIK